MKKKYRKRKMPKYFFIISLVLFLFIGVGYSVINSNLSLQGNVTKAANTWSILFQNPVFDNDSITSPVPTITSGTTMTMNVSLSNPGDKYAFTIDLKNNGNIPALINTLTMTQLTTEQQNYLRWKVEYEDESTPEVGDLLKAGETKKVHILLEYKKLRAIDLYPKDNVNINLSITLNFYLPEESYNTVTLTKNGSTKNIQVSNLEQSVTLTDFPIETTDKVIACNTGVEPSTDTNNKIVLSKVKQDATCRIETSLYNAINNSNNEKTYISFINDSEDTSNKITVANNQNIILDLNGHNYQISQDDVPHITNEGILVIKDSKGTGKINGYLRLLKNKNTGTLTLLNGYYERYHSEGSGSGGIIEVSGGTVNINNSHLKTDAVYAVFTNGESIVNISNSTLERSGNSYIIAFYTQSNKSIINIRNSSIINNNAIPIGIQNINKNYLYLCNTTITTNTSLHYHIAAISGANTYVYYKYDNNFTGTITNFNTNSYFNSNIIESDIACAE